MKITEYASLPTEELIQFAMLRDGATSLEIELAQRLMVAADMIADITAGVEAEVHSPEVAIDGTDAGR